MVVRYMCVSGGVKVSVVAHIGVCGRAGVCVCVLADVKVMAAAHARAGVEVSGVVCWARLQVVRWC